MEVIGEAANRVPEEAQAAYPDLPWMAMIGARNHLIHGYDHVDFDILWNIAHNDLPRLDFGSDGRKLGEGTADVGEVVCAVGVEG